MTTQLFPTMDIGSGSRDPGLVGLLRDTPITEEQVGRVVAFIDRVDPALSEAYTGLVKQPYPERVEKSKDFLTQLSVGFLHNSGYSWSYNLEWLRTEMVDYERNGVGGFRKSTDWQHSYGKRFWKPSEIVEEITYQNSDGHLDELRRLQKWAPDPIRFPLTDAHCEIHSNDNLFYFGRWLPKERDEVIAAMKADHEATMEFASKVTKQRVRLLSENTPSDKKIAVQLDNFLVTCDEYEYDPKRLKQAKFDAPSYIQMLKESTPSYGNVEYFIHNCLQQYSLYIPYLVEVPNVRKFNFEMSSHDTDRLGTTDKERKGPGFESLKVFKEHGLRKNQVVGVGVASTYEGATPPAPELVRDRILYAVKVLEDPWKVEPVLDCGERNLDLQTMFNIGARVHEGRDLALKVVGKEHGIDVEPFLTKGYLHRRV